VSRSASIGDDRLRVAPWRGDPSTAYLVARRGRPTPFALARCLEQLAGGGYRSALTAALAPADQEPWLANGFVVHERLHLLSRPVEPAPEAPAVELQRARRRDRPSVLAVDASAFPPFWRLDEAGLDDALTATPSSRFRVAGGPHGTVLAYAVTGRAGPRGYLQRLAVAPAAQRRGLATALVADGLRWLRRWGAHDVLVNTQVGNDAAVALYEDLGFRRLDEGLAVLQRPLAAPSR
jgi:ribosomal protein S18 acetylase RimI-like enzyme